MAIESDSLLSGYRGEMAGVVGAEVEGLWLRNLYSETFVFSEHCCVCLRTLLRHFVRSWVSGVLSQAGSHRPESWLCESQPSSAFRDSGVLVGVLTSQ